SSPGPISPMVSPATRTRAEVTRCKTAFTFSPKRTIERSVEAAHLPWLRLGDLLVRDGLISLDQLREALQPSAETGQLLGQIVLERGWISGRHLAQALAEQYALQYIELQENDVDRVLAARLPENLARRYRAIPVRKTEDGFVLVAVADPTNVVTSDDLRLAF